MEDPHATVALLAAGEPPTAPACTIWREAAVRVACDGALRTARALGVPPDWVVGDGDSLTHAEKAELDSRFIHESEQETNDLTKAFRFANAHYAHLRHLIILGAAGGREDHFLGNLFHLPEYAQRWRAARGPLASVALVTAAGRFDVVLESARFAVRPQEPFSVFAPEPDTHVSSQGLAWPLDGVDLSALWKGTLNRTTAQEVALSTNRPILVYRPADPTTPKRG